MTTPSRSRSCMTHGEDDILAVLENWLAAGETVALATVIRTWGSSPRRAGSHLAITRSGKISGSVSGGCIEAAVAEAALETLETGLPRLLSYGVTDDRAWEVGLACGGTVEIMVEPIISVEAIVAAELGASENAPI